jgi:NAD(P)-dependent dehydrogenase (short-subunit alcohol dehydrogenase family)
MASSQIILVTGANRGIGFSIVQITALRLPTATYILACRSESSGQEAITRLKSLGVTATLEVLVLDVTSDTSILSAASFILSKYGHLDGTISFPSSLPSPSLIILSPRK